MTRRSICALAAACAPLPCFAAEQAWILAGQSNMGGGHSSYAAALKGLTEAKGHSYSTILSTRPGRPIEDWIDPKSKGYPELWKEKLAVAVPAARAEGKEIAGMVWYQGESNVKDATTYPNKLRELIANVRRLAGAPELPVIVVQIGAATSYSQHGSWAAGVMREMQRRVAAADPQVELVAAADCEVGDYTVHISRKGHEVIAKRIAAAAEHLVHGGETSGWGPQFKRAYAVGDRRHVVVEFENVRGQLFASGGWQQAFGLSRETEIAEDMTSMGAIGKDYEPPANIGLQARDTLLLEFVEPVPKGARLSFAAGRNAQHGAARRWELEFSGPVDESGAFPPAFALVDVGDGPVDYDRSAIKVLSLSKRPELSNTWRQIGINCVGRFPAGVLSQQAEAGAPGWRQRFWNPASAGPVDNLSDIEGRATPVRFTTGVWYMSPIKREPQTPDETLMSGWCSEKWHVLEGLEAGAAYDLQIYLDQSGDGSASEPVHVLVAHSAFDKEGNFDPKRKAPGDGRGGYEVLLQRVVNEPKNSEGLYHFEGMYIPATEVNGHIGNTLLAEKMKADKTGRLYLAVYRPRGVKATTKGSKTVLNALQIRASR